MNFNIPIITPRYIKIAVLIVIMHIVAIFASLEIPPPPPLTEQPWVSGTTTITLNNGVLRIHGIGTMEDYDEYGNYPPWLRIAPQITTVFIEEGVTHIGDFAFTRYRNLTSIIIPNTVTTIGEEAFYGCTGLTTVTIPNSVTTIKKHAFSRCIGLMSITIPSSVITIKKYAFSGCIGLKSITIEDGVAIIEAGAFSKCTNLISVTIPNSVMTIGKNTFEDCTNLTSIIIHNPTPLDAGSQKFDNITTKKPTVRIPKQPEVDPRAFDYIHLHQTCLYVPARSINAYRSAEIWKDFNCIKPIASDEISVSWFALGILVALILSATLFIIIKKSRKRVTANENLSLQRHSD